MISSVHTEPVTAGKPRWGAGAQHHGHQEPGRETTEVPVHPLPPCSSRDSSEDIAGPDQSNRPRTVGEWRMDSSATLEAEVEPAEAEWSTSCAPPSPGGTHGSGRAPAEFPQTLGTC